jgi:hypothetical protein
MRFYSLLFLAVVCPFLGAQGSGRFNPDLLSSVVKIETAPTTNGTETGTGFLFSTTGDASGKTLLITNKHMIGDWNYADRDIRSYWPWIEVFFYRTADDPSGRPFRATKIALLNSSGALDTSRVFPHSFASIDLVAIDISDNIKEDKKEHIRSFAFTKSYTVPFDKIKDFQTDIGDEVIALGSPLGISSQRNNYPIAKIGYLASIPGEEVSIPFRATNRAGVALPTTVEGKFLVVDGLIVPGNSGGPVVLVGGVRVSRDQQSNKLLFTDKPIPNFAIGVVSALLDGSGLSIVVSSDYLDELMKSANSKSAK